MRSVVRGVTLFAVGTMLCAGLVFTADRGIGVSSSKADRVRADGVGTVERSMHPTRVHRVDRDEVMDYLNRGQRAQSALNAKVDQLIGHAQTLAEKGDTEGAIEFMQSARGIQVPDSRMGEFHTVLGDLYAQGTTVSSLQRAAGNYERAASYTDGRDEIIDLLQQAGDLYRSAGRIDAAQRVDQNAENARRGRTVEFGQNSSGFTANLNTVGVADSCDTAIAAALPYNETGINIENFLGLDHDWYSITVAENTLLNAATNAGAGTTDDDTDLTLYDGCDAGTPGAQLAFDDDGGPGLLSSISGVCVAPGTYYLELGGWADFASPNDITLDITSGGTCFIPVADEFEPDNEVNASFIGCDTLAAEDEENEDEEDESGSDSEDDESSEDAGVCADDDLEPYCLDGETICVEVGSGSSSSSSGTVIPDGAEPGECPDPGTICELLQTQCRTIFPEGDIDFVVFNAGDEPRRIIVETGAAEECGNAPGDEDPDTIIAITDAFGNIFAVNDDKGGGSFGSRFEFCAPANQDFNVAVLGFSATDTFAYQLTVDATTACLTETEANGSCALANDIGLIPADGTPVIVGGFRTPFQDPFGTTFVEDQDWYTLTLPPGGCDVTFLTDATDTQRTDTELEAYIANTFFDPASDPCTDVDNGVNSIGFSDDLDAFLGIFTSGLSGSLPEAQYFLRVTASQAFASPGPPFVYDLIVFCDPPPEPDIYEPNDTPATATPLTLGTGFTASIHVPGDLDFYSFDLTGDTQVLCDADTTASGGDTVLELLSGTDLIACDDDGNTGTAPSFDSLFDCCLPPGSYVVGVKDWQSGGGPGDGAIAEYTLTCTALAACSADPDPLNAVCFDDGDPFGQCPF